MELASGVDALYLSGRAPVLEEVAATLEERRGMAQATREDVTIEIGGVEFIVRPHGFGKYRYCLVHRHGQIGVLKGRQLPSLRVQPRAEFLHGVGPAAAVEWFHEVLTPVFWPIWWSVSRLDLFSDWQGWSISGDERRRFVCRADAVATHEERHVLTGLEFGRRTSHTVCARIYDKTTEIARSGAGFWPEIWGDRRTSDDPVMRVEFEFGREGLRQLGLESPEEAIAAAGALWTYATRTWLTLRAESRDATRSRWPIDGCWQEIQRAGMVDGAFGIERMYEGRRAGDLLALTPGLIGYLSSFAALSGTEDIDDTLPVLGDFLLSWQAFRRRSFRNQVGEKRRKMVRL